ncbi:hypothetical protein K8P63_00330 [Sphingomonas nostoxanthinifaciens]|nr:hypothetical protein K8P63_00330 [Sphingomonas nostoxanthinifaciens]
MVQPKHDVRGTKGLTSIKKNGSAGREKTGAEAGAKRPRDPDQHVANALRSAYEEAIQEDVPPEFLDLLRKLN